MSTPRSNLTTYIQENYVGALGVLAKVVDEISDAIRAFSEADVRIIDQCLKIFCQGVAPENYPIHFQFKKDNKSKRKFPAYELPNNNLKYDEKKLGRNALAQEFRSIILDFIDCYNNCRNSWVPTDSSATNHILLYLIDACYYFSHISLKELKTLEELNSFMDKVERLMAIEEMESGYFTGNIDKAKDALGRARYLLLNKCKPIVVDIHKKRSAADLLDQLTDLIKSLCCNGFNIALHILSKDKQHSSVSLINIEREKQRKEGRKEVRKYAIDSRKKDDTPEKNSIQWFIYNLSKSLLLRLDNLTQRNEKYDPYVTHETISYLADSKSDVYGPLKQKKCMHYYECFTSDLEKFSELSKLITEAKLSCSDRGNLYFFVVATHASRMLLTQIETIHASFSNAYKELRDIVKHESAENLDLKPTSEQKGWRKTYNHMVQVDFPEIEMDLKLIGDISKSLTDLHKEFSEEKITTVRLIYEKSKSFRAAVNNFQNALIKQNYSKANRLYVEKEDTTNLVDDLEEHFDTEEVENINDLGNMSSSSMENQAHKIFNSKDNNPIYKQKFDRMALSKKNRERILQKIEKFLNAEIAFAKTNIGSKKDVDKLAYKYCYDRYEKLDNELAKIRVLKDLNATDIEFIFECHMELAKTQLEHLITLKMHGNLTDQENKKYLNQFSEKCLSVEKIKLENSEAENSYKKLIKEIQRAIDAKSSIPDDENLQSLTIRPSFRGVKQIAEIKESKNTTDKVKAPPFTTTTAYQPHLFAQQKSPAQKYDKAGNINNIQVIKSPTETKGLNILSIQEEKSSSITSPAKIVNKVLPKNDLDDIDIYSNKLRNLRLKAKLESVNISPIAKSLFEILKSSAPDFECNYNGWNFFWSHSKEHNIDRHKRHNHHYEILLQCTAYLTNGAVCEGYIDGIIEVTEERLLDWIQAVLEDEKKYWGQYILYTNLKDAFFSAKQFCYINRKCLKLEERNQEQKQKIESLVVEKKRYKELNDTLKDRISKKDHFINLIHEQLEQFKRKYPNESIGLVPPLNQNLPTTKLGLR